MLHTLALVFTLCWLSSLAEAGAFGTVNFYADSSCSLGYNPRSAGATDSYTSWSTLPTSSMSNLTSPRCVSNPTTTVASAIYSCSYIVDTTSGQKHQAIFISEFDETCGLINTYADGEESPVLNYYSMTGNASITSSFPLCVGVSWFNNRNHSSFYARISCNGISTQAVSSSTSEMYAQSVMGLTDLPDGFGAHFDENSAASFSVSTSALILLSIMLIVLAL